MPVEDTAGSGTTTTGRTDLTSGAAMTAPQPDMRGQGQRPDLFGLAVAPAPDTSRAFDPVDPRAELAEIDAVDTARTETARATTDPRLPVRVAQQLVEAARALPDRPVEIALNPEELGRVKMTLAVSDGSVTVSLMAERAETADLLRRNIAMLGDEFRDLGFDDISFSFAGGQAGEDHQSSDGRRDAAAPTLSETSAADDTGAETVAPMRLTLGDGIDIRL